MELRNKIEALLEKMLARKNNFDDCRDECLKNKDWEDAANCDKRSRQTDLFIMELREALK